jgi:hypothetical protein
LAGALVAVAVLAPPPAHAGSDDTTTSPNDPAGEVLLLLRLPPDHFRPENAYSGGYGDGAAHAARRRVAAALARQHGLTLVTDWPMPLLGVDCYAMRVPPTQSPERVAQELSRDPQVAWAQVTNVYRTRGHNDPLYALQPAAWPGICRSCTRWPPGATCAWRSSTAASTTGTPTSPGQIALKENFVDGAATCRRAARHRGGRHHRRARRQRHRHRRRGARCALLALRACWEQARPGRRCAPA